MIWGSRGSKSRLAKAAGAEPAGQMRDEKLHAVVARSTFPSQNVQNTPFSDHFWKLRCRKSARRCGAKHISKSKCTKHRGADHFWQLRCQKSARRCGAKHISKSKCTEYTILGPLLEVEMSKKCTPLWREAHFQVKMYKAHHSRTTFGSSVLEKVHAVVARSTFPSQNAQNTRGADHFWKFSSRKSAKCQKTLGGEDHFWTFSSRKKCTPLWREAYFEVKMLKTLGVWTTFGGSDVASLHYTTLHYLPLHFTTLHYTSLHYNYNYNYNYTPLHSTTLH